jgi:hypothetical protein
LPVAALAAELDTGLVHETQAMEPTGRQLPAVGVQGQITREGNAAPAIDEGSTLTGAAKSEGLKPIQRNDAEAVIQLRDVDVGGPEISPGP